MRGETLRARLERGPLSAAEVFAIGVSMLEALAHAHAAGILHRDVKPENVMLRPDGSMKLLDFGLARALSTPAETRTHLHLTGEGLTVGTVGYMAPEQLRGDPLDARADLFALGAVLYECLTGRPAFPGRNAVERIAAILSGGGPAPPPPPAPVGLSQLLERALSRDRNARPSTAGEFLRDLRSISDGAETPPVPAGPDTLAIVDFENLSGDPADAWLGSGIAESVGADLARVDGLQVISREYLVKARLAHPSGADALDLAQALGCRWVLAGSYQKLGPMLRIAARLAEVATGRVAWAEKLDGPFEQVFAMQDRLSAAVTSSLNLRAPVARSSGGRPQLSAYECYPRGRRLFERLEKGSMDQARAFYEQAISLDPKFAPAYAGLAGMYAMRFTFTTDPAVLHAAIDHATRAIALDPTLGDPHVWRGYAWWRLGRPEDGLREEEIAMALDPSLEKAPYFAGAILLDLGRPLEALPFEQRAVRVAEGYPYAWLVLGIAHLRLDRLDEAQWCFDRCRQSELAPGAPIVGAGAGASEVLRRRGDRQGARATALQALEGLETADHMYRDTHRALCLGQLGRLALDEGDTGGAAAIFGQALSHLRGRPQALGGGHHVVQSLAGLARATGDVAALEEALALWRSRAGYNFGWAFLASELDSAVQLAIAAATLRHPEAAQLAAQARTAGATSAELDQIASAGEASRS